MFERICLFFLFKKSEAKKKKNLYTNKLDT